jgi:hypothetical protein
MADLINNKIDNFKEDFSNNSFNKTGGLYGERRGADWPQEAPIKLASPKSTDPKHVKGFLPPDFISPRDKDDNYADAAKLSEFKILDWRGHLLETDPDYDIDIMNFGVALNHNQQNALGKMKLSGNKGFIKQPEQLSEQSGNPATNPYSIRDVYNIFDDTSTDYFKHGIYIDRQSLNDENGITPPKYDTPEENTDPVIFGFELEIDVIGSPLFNGAIDDFIALFPPNSELGSKKEVYEDFKKQFAKLFKTNALIDGATNSNGGHLLSDTGTSNINTIANSPSDHPTYGKAAYMSYYLKKVGGLKNLSESNGSGSFKYLTDYRKDVMTLTFNEDVTLTLGTLASLYKLLYWSKPNGKSLIPENLLRFNCKIVVSELRNYNRVKTSGAQVDIIRDNLSRYVYSLNECQFFFNTRPHGDSIDRTATPVYTDYEISFDYKYSTTKFERWNPNTSTSLSYNNGAMWDFKGEQSDFYKFKDPLQYNDFLIKKYITSNSDSARDVARDAQAEEDRAKQEEEDKLKVDKDSSDFEKFKTLSKKAGEQIGKNIEKLAKQAVNQAIQNKVNQGTALINQSLNKALNAVAGTRGIKPPTNVYNDNTTLFSRFFYDVRGSLADFAGNGITGLI